MSETPQTIQRVVINKQRWYVINNTYAVTEYGIKSLFGFVLRDYCEEQRLAHCTSKGVFAKFRYIVDQIKRKINYKRIVRIVGTNTVHWENCAPSSYISSFGYQYYFDILYQDMIDGLLSTIDDIDPFYFNHNIGWFINTIHDDYVRYQNIRRSQARREKYSKPALPKL